MKRFVTESVILLTIALVARFVAEARHPAPALFLLAAYAAVLIYLSEDRQDREATRLRRLEERLADASARECRLGEALVLAATEVLWVEEVVETTSVISYVIDVPERGRIVVHLPADDATKTEDASETSEEG